MPTNQNQITTIHRILVVGNYPPDHLQSMERYAKLLVRLYASHGDVRLVRPPVLVGGLSGLPPLARKYLAYIDKLLIFPLWLYFTARRFQLVHIADHSNGFYAFCSPPRRCIVTCHDLLAVRAAMGDAAAACDTSPIGIWLQRLIMAGLRRSGRLLFVSQATLADYQRLGGGPPGQRNAVIPNSINAPFTADPEELPLSHAERSQLPAEPYLLMVGSALPRKNRALALQVLQQLGTAVPYRLVFAGAPLSPAEEAFRRSHPLGYRLLSLVRPSHALLNQLYCRAHALLFPSISEGFGWPVVEAQVCGCPVIASTTTSIPEVAGTGAFYADPHDATAFSRHVLALEDPYSRASLIREGFRNARRFAPELIEQAYLSFAFS
ncbi:glycosyltransferase family 4 protein [Synechococcus sp. HK05]|uniref:glycosyltransferase family 4 protein n=1 Tax=Synechococcus sp. HK05 TaxID=2725975 RepID=UPI001C38FBA4|nr:glycosyltransferase family 4 protein [Synechococcus sp. HK05]